VNLTDEQIAYVDLYRQGIDLVVEAGAGTGKSSTLKAGAHADPRRAAYIAYNRSTADDAGKSFPWHVQCNTAHGFASRAVGRRFMGRRNSSARQPAKVTAEILARLNRPAFEIGLDAGLHRTGLARLTMRTLDGWCKSADREVLACHVPDTPQLRPDERRGAVAAAVMLAATAWHDLQYDDASGKGELPFTHDCQPPGTLVRRVVRRGGNLGATHEDVPIEQIREGDHVVSVTLTQRRGYVRRAGRAVTAVGFRDYSGDLTTVTTARGRRSSYTDTHKCLVRLDCDLADGNHVVYLARRGADYRVGRTTWRTRSQGNTLGIRRRAESQGADAMWVLSVHATDADAALEEALVAHRWRLPTWQFRSPNETMPLAQFWAKVGNNGADARACLAAHGLHSGHPFWQYGDGWQTTHRPVVLRAANLLPGMLMLEPDEIEPCGKGELHAFDGSGGWSPITVTRSPYGGPVYNLDVDVDHTYVADGIATHNCYLKMWALTNPRLPVDVVMFDEAQDANPVMAGVVEGQTHAQRVAVGDRCQAINGWNGAVDAMSGWPWHRLTLSQSFRFGPAVADVANLWLEALDGPIRLRGYDALDTRVGYCPEPTLILCRGNVTAIVAADREINDGRRVAMAGGTGEVKRLAFAARDLQAGRPTDHPQLYLFSDWDALREYAEDEGSDLLTFVKLIDRFGTGWVLRVCADLVRESEHPDVVVSTVHKAKGRESANVLIAGDFPEPGDVDLKGDPVPFTREDGMLAYVATTRARELLDLGGLAWIQHAAPVFTDGDTAEAAA
jgi:hypothetical protein